MWGIKRSRERRASHGLAAAYATAIAALALWVDVMALQGRFDGGAPAELTITMTATICFAVAIVALLQRVRGVS